MPTVRCPSCHKSFRAPDNAAGQRIRCPQCNESVLVEAAPDERVRAEEPRQGVRAAPPVEARRPARDEDAPSAKSSLGLVLGLVLAGVVVVGLCGGGVLALGGLAFWGAAVTGPPVPAPPVAGGAGPAPGLAPVAKGADDAPVRVVKTPHKTFMATWMDVVSGVPDRAVVYVRERARGGSVAHLESLGLVDGKKVAGCTVRADELVKDPGEIQQFQLRAASPDGQRVLFSYERELLRELFAVVDIDGKAVRQDWQLNRKRAADDRSGRDIPRSLIFLDAGRLLVGYPDSSADVFSVATSQPAALLAPRPAVRTNTAATFIFAVSGDKQTVFSWRGEGNFALNDLGTRGDRGKLTLALEKEEVIHMLLRAAFSPDNRRVALYALLSKEGEVRPILATWEIATGRQLPLVEMPRAEVNNRGEDRIVWWGNDHVLVGESSQAPAHLIHVSAGKQVGRVTLPPGAQIARGGGGALWMFVNDTQDVNAAPVLFGVPFPAAQVRRCTGPESMLTITPDAVRGP